MGYRGVVTPEIWGAQAAGLLVFGCEPKRT